MAAVGFPIKKRQQHGWDQVRSTLYSTQCKAKASAIRVQFCFRWVDVPASPLGYVLPCTFSGPLSTQPRPLSIPLLPTTNDPPTLRLAANVRGATNPSCPSTDSFPPSVVDIQEILLYTRTCTHTTHEHSYHQRPSPFTITVSDRSYSSYLFDQDRSSSSSCCHSSLVVSFVTERRRLFPRFFLSSRALCPSIHPSETIA